MTRLLKFEGVFAPRVLFRPRPPHPSLSVQSARLFRRRKWRRRRRKDDARWVAAEKAEAVASFSNPPAEKSGAPFSLKAELP